MIRVGTLCLLIGSAHDYIGYECTVIGPLTLGRAFGSWNVRHFYPIDIPKAAPDARPDIPWGATPSELLPLSPPPQTVDERERVPLTIPAIGVSIGYG